MSASLEPNQNVGQLYIVATPIGNLDDITLRAISVLKQVDLICAEDTRHSRKLLQHLGINKPMLAVHEHNEVEISTKVIAKLQQGEHIALISDAGTPLISDPGYPLVQRCRQESLCVTPIPGASALITALSVSGLATDRFLFQGFMPRKSQARLEYLNALKFETATLVFYESSHRILAALQGLAQVFGEQRQAAVARELTKMHETILSGDLVSICEQVAVDENQRKGEFVVVVSGAPEKEAASDADVDKLLALLIAELPVKKAATIAASYTGEKKNKLYERALALK